MKHFLSAEDVTEPEKLIELAAILKYSPKSHQFNNKSVCLIFFNPSLRTRLSTEIAAKNLGAEVTALNLNGDSWKLEFEEGVVMDMDKAEHIKEAAAVLGAYYDLIAIRSFPGLTDREEDYKENILNAFVKFSGVPVVNLESSTVHPLQSLADMLTIQENSNTKNPKIVLSWAPHPGKLPQAVPNSFSQWALKCKHNLTIVQPEGFELNENFTKGANIEYDQKKAFDGADFIYVKSWSSYINYGNNAPQLKNWMIDMKKLENCPNAKIMHCLPVRRNVVLTDEVLDSNQSIVIEQAENRIYSAQAVLKTLLDDE